MNASIKAALKNPQSRCFQLRSAFFHSTSFLDKGCRNTWNSSWESDFARDEEPSNKGPSWFNRSNHRSRRNGQGRQNKGPRGFIFCEDDDDDVETVFRSAFGDRFFVWSYVDENYPNGRRSSRNSKSHMYKSSWS